MIILITICGHHFNNAVTKLITNLHGDLKRRGESEGRMGSKCVVMEYKRIEANNGSIVEQRVIWTVPPKPSM